MHFTTLFAAAGLFSVGTAQYTLVQDFFSGNFFDNFDFFTGADPTGGFVNYVDQQTAQNDRLINTNNGAYIGVDSTSSNVAAPGRNSVRLSSKQAYTYMLVVLELNNMPSGAGTWPAFWTFGPDWPNNGEIDIIEGVNDQSTNFMTLHLGQSCSISGGGNGLLQAFSTDCDANDNSNQGCSFHDDSSQSYGSGFNQAGGGIFAMEWTSSGVSIWRWIGQGGGSSAPADVLSDTPNPANWGPPSANWASSSSNCDFAQDLSQHNIIFDTTFCGQWAGSAYPGGLDACQDFVANNPSAFTNAYWGVNALKVYQQGASTNNNIGTKPSPSSSSAVVTQAASSSLAVSSTPVATSFTTMASAPTQQTSISLLQAEPTATASPSVAQEQPSPASPNANASPTLQPLTEGDFGAGSQGIPEGSEGWTRRAVDTRMGERRLRRRSHMARHIQAAKS